jgi:NAD(P)H-flavin reductase
VPTAATLAPPPAFATAHEPGPMTPTLFRIKHAKREVPGVFTWRLVALDGKPFPFAAGQFNMIYTFGVGEVPICISGDPRRPRELVHTIRAVGPVTEAMQRLEPGTVVGIRGPFGRPWPVDLIVGSDVLFVTGTIGLAPLRPLILEVLHRRDEFGRVVICYGSRGVDDVLYKEDLMRWRGRFDTNVHVTVHSAPAGYRGRVGSVAAAVRIARVDGASTQAFVCRSEAMTRPAVEALAERGVTPDRIWVTLERSMKCGIALCGHCQLGPTLMCRDGPVYRYSDIARLFETREL